MTLPTECLKFFASFIEREIGIVYSEVNYYQLEARLADIAKQLQLSGPVELWQNAQLGGVTGAAKLLLLDTATNNETSFFRDPNVFKAIEALVRQTADNSYTAESPFRVWSAACSTGQEIYSLAMLFQTLKDSRSFHYTIHATDISERVLRRAEDGRYTELEAQRGLSREQISRFLTAEKTAGTAREGPMEWVVKPELKRGLSFQKLNLLEPWQSLGSYHLILCRNVLIYQTVDNKTKVVRKLYERLHAGGYLILGGAESLIGIFDDLVYQTLEGTVVYRKRADAALRPTG